MIIRTDTLERLDCDGARDKVWMDINHNYPFPVSVNFSGDQYKQAKLWCEQRNIKFNFKTSNGWNRRSNYPGPGIMRFQKGPEALMFQLALSSFAN